MKKTILILSLIFITGIKLLQAQNKVIDQLVAIVGSHMIMQSDIENQYLQYTMQGYNKTDSNFKCNLLEQTLYEKLLLNQAEIDSLTVTESQIESDLERRVKYFSKQMGGDEQLEKYYNKSISQIKEDFRDIIKNQLLQQSMEAKITEKIKVTPTEVKRFFNTLPKDSVPTVSSHVEVGEIVIGPKINDEEKAKAKEKLSAIRDRIIKGEDFATLAVLYSEDEGTASKGGELGFTERSELDAVFAAAAFKLNANEISPVIQSQFGYHIIQLIERRGEKINVRHILIRPKVATEDLLAAKLKLDTVYSLIKADSITFEKAALKYSNDPSRANGGLMINPESGASKFEPDQLDQSVFFVVDKLKVGEFSKPVPMKTDDGKQAYRILYLKSRTDPHRANMKDDYDFIQQAALKQKQSKATQDWVKKQAAVTYIHIADEYKDCKYNYHWFN